MQIISDIKLESFKAWSGGVETLENIIKAGKVDMLESLLEECYTSLTDTQLNDILWFDSDWLYEQLDMEEFLE